MIEKVSFFQHWKTKAINKLHTSVNSVKYGVSGIKQLKQDIFELKKGMPEVLSYSPPIIEGHFYTELKDIRFASFSTKFQAYNFEGFDDKFPNDYVCIDSKGDRRLKPHVYLQYVEIKPEYARKGIYSRTVKKLIQQVKNDKECEGRIILDARKIESPNMTKIPSPSLAHWKCGFRFIDEENNNIMQKVLKGELPLEDAPEGTMYFPLD